MRIATSRLLLSCILFLSFLPRMLQAQHHECDVIRYNVLLTFDIEHRSIAGEADILLRNTSRSPIPAVSFDLRENTVSAVRMEGSDIAWSQIDSVLTVTFPSPLASLDTTIVTVHYAGTHPAVTPGMYRTGVMFGEHVVSAKAQSSVDWYVSTTCHWLPCNNVFADKAIYDITYDVPAGIVAAGQGTLIDQQCDGARSRFHWRMRDPIHPHTAGWAVGPYYRIQRECMGYPVEYYVEKGFSLEVDKYFERLPDMIATFEQEYGPYPGEKIGFAITDAGSQESHTLVILEHEDLGEVARPQVEAHELAHHWFGNCVTPMDLRENWLSEGFAMYSEILYRANTTMQARLDDHMHSYVNLYIKGVAVSEGIQPLYNYMGHGAPFNYSSVIYIKGALVLNMLRHVVGDSLYHAAMHEYFRRYRYANVTTEMFRAVMEEITQVPLQQYFQQWVYEKGWPILTAKRVAASSGDPMRIRIRQLQTDRGWCLYELPLVFKLTMKNGEEVEITRWLHPQEEDILQLPGVLDEEVVEWSIDPAGIMLMEMTKITDVRQDEAAALNPSITACYPQPVPAENRILHVELNAPKAAACDLQLYDMLGRQVRSVYSQGTAGALRHHAINTAGLPSGTYLLRLAGDSRTSQLVVLR
ncbi:T9SS type A sorting domain-containing protein [bacterium]|nr:T9SS type A sorting domain-containing protein [bacterium]